MGCALETASDTVQEQPSSDAGEPVGIVYGEIGTQDFSCSVTAPLERMDYIQVKHESYGNMLCQVMEVERHSDLSEERAMRLASGQPMPINEKVRAKVSVIGYRDERNLLQSPGTPVRAGELIFKAEDNLIRQVLGLRAGEKVGAYVGLLKGHELQIFLDINTLVNKHMSILAKTGGGKSYISGVVIEELMKHNVTVVIVDPHGEYSTLGQAGKSDATSQRFGVTPRGYKDKVVEFSPNTKANPHAKPLKFTLANMDARELLSLLNVKDIKHVLPTLKSAIEALRTAKPNFTIDDLVNILEANEEVDCGTLISDLQYLKEIDIFAANGTKISDIVQKGMTTILNMRGVHADISEMIVNRLATALYELSKEGKVPPMMVLFEEAHNYCPQGEVKACSKIIRTIAAEGRKFGLGLCIITQRPARVDKSVLSQCNTQLILKITNPLDLKAVTSSIEGLTRGMDDEIQRLPIGMALIAGGNLGFPMIVEVRSRETKHGGESIKVIDD
jgi:DNA helicase HerA-like ATPase